MHTPEPIADLAARVCDGPPYFTPPAMFIRTGDLHENDNDGLPHRFPSSVRSHRDLHVDEHLLAMRWVRAEYDRTMSGLAWDEQARVLLHVRALLASDSDGNPDSPGDRLVVAQWRYAMPCSCHPDGREWRCRRCGVDVARGREWCDTHAEVSHG